jgi:hypothetical protein
MFAPALIEDRQDAPSLTGWMRVFMASGSDHIDSVNF